MGHGYLAILEKFISIDREEGLSLCLKKNNEKSYTENESLLTFKIPISVTF